MISVYLNGRLGNNLFQYAFCRIASYKQRCNFYIPKNQEESITFYNECSQKFKKYFEPPNDNNPHFWIGEKLFEVDYGINDGYINNCVANIDIEKVTDGTLLIDFYQSDSYLLEFRDMILNDWYKFRESVVADSRSILEKYNINEYCYIHLRGGDYKTIPQYFLPIEYYRQGMEQIKEIVPNMKFLVITDDIILSKIMFPDLEVISNTKEIDFYLISKSKYKIIPNSSFSWWSAWLSQENKMTIAPNNWFNYNSGDGFSPQGIKTSFFNYI